MPTADTQETIVRRLARWVSGLRLDGVPDEVRHAARRSIVDTFAVALAGSRLPVATRVREHAMDQCGDGTCALIGTGAQVSALAAALANGVAAHALDFDDTSYAGMIHGSAVILPAALAAAQREAIGGKGLMEAFIAGSEAAYALGLAVTGSHYMGGWWATGTLGGIGAAAGAARALGLGEAAAANAIALATVQAAGMTAVLGTDAKPIQAGRAARLGVEAALLAGQGNTAPAGAFEDRRGFLALMNEGRSDPAGLAELGRQWRLLDPGIFFKRYPVCSAAQAAAELTDRLIRDNGLKADAIASVRCQVPHLVRISLVHERPRIPAEAQFSMPFAVGCILGFGTLGPEQISEQALADVRLRAATEKVGMVEAEDLDTPDHRARYPECARVTVTTTNGEKVSGFLGAPTGMPENPVRDDGLSDKFRTCARFAGWPDSRSERVLTALWDIESVRDLSTLFLEAA